jgi:hypothetical protein
VQQGLHQVAESWRSMGPRIGSATEVSDLDKEDFSRNWSWFVVTLSSEFSTRVPVEDRQVSQAACRASLSDPNL